MLQEHILAKKENVYKRAKHNFDTMGLQIFYKTLANQT